MNMSNSTYICSCGLDGVAGYDLASDIDCPGNNMWTGVVQTPQECGDLCDGTDGCVAFVVDTRVAGTMDCYHKSTCDSLIEFEGVHTYRQGNVQN